MTQDHWNHVANEKTHPWSGVPPILRDWLATYSPSPLKALDLGCSKGDKSRWLVEQGYQVTGIDISDVAIKEAKAASPDFIRFLTADLADLSSLRFRTDHGLILDWLASQFLEKDQQAGHFTQLFSRLSPGGYVFYARVDESGSDAPAWVKNISMPADTLEELISRFEVVDTRNVKSGNLPSTRVTRLALRKGS